ncbi:MAG: hypothetical protein WAO20_08585 [Acidobacteriota bacterium]
MGRKSRLKRERRSRSYREGEQPRWARARAEQAAREEVDRLETELNRLADGEASFWRSQDSPLEDQQTFLEDVLAFESVDKGVSLFRGLQQKGMKLPPPEELNEKQSRKKVGQIFKALSKLGVFLVGFENMSAREFYSKLYHQTLWEACYVEKRQPGAITMMDVSHSMTRGDFEALAQHMQPETVH